MATIYSNQYKNINSNKANKSNETGGRVRMLFGRYVQSGSEGAVADVIVFGKLPKNARILPGGKVYFSTGTALSTLKIGWGAGAATDDDLLVATSITTAGSAALDAGAAFASGVDVTMSADTDIVGTVAGAIVAAGQVIAVYLPYVVD